MNAAGQAATLLQAPRRPQRWRRLFTRRTLPTQCLWAGAAITGAVVVAARWLEPQAPAAAAYAACAGAVVTLALWGWTRHVASVLGRLQASARLLVREELSGAHNFETLQSSEELRSLALGLQRVVQAGRERIRALESRNAVLGHQLEARSHELSTLEDLSIGLAGESDLSELVDDALAALGQTMDYSSASVWARKGQRAGAQVVLLGCRSPQASDDEVRALTGGRLSRANLSVYEQIERERRPMVENSTRTSVLSWLWALITDDTATGALYRQTRSWTALPLQAREAVVGVLRVDHQEVDYFDAARSKLLSAVAAQTALAMRHAELATREREVAVVTERHRIARDLHDAVSQTLFAAQLIAGTLARERAPGEAVDATAMAEQARQLERLNRAALSEMRLLMFELRPDAMAQVDLADLLLHAIDALAGRGEFAVDTSLARGETLDGATRVQLYRIAQEALSNVARHSEAHHIEVQWRWAPGIEAVLRIADDGKGFTSGSAEPPEPGHFGLGNMQSRADEIGAVLTIDTSPGRGAELVVRLPLNS